MFYHNDFRLGILGGGQLGRMFIQSAIPYDVFISILDPNPEAPCSKLASEFVVGDFNDYQTVKDFGKGKDVLTIEIEHVNVEALMELKKEGVKVYPDPEILKIIQDKGLQKSFYSDHNIPTSPFEFVDSKDDLGSKISAYPIIQKLRKGGYDGRGVQVLKSESDLNQAFDGPSILEEFVDFEKELSVIVSRNANGDSSVFPLVELEFNPEANLVEYLFSPARVSDKIEKEANRVANLVVEALDFVGILAIELFLTRDGKILVNEIAPRTHNSGHHSIEGNVTSQFEQHLRSVLNLPLGSSEMVKPAVMVNLLGENGFEGEVKYEGLEEILQEENVHIHLYGKKMTKSFRKMGHITIIDDELETAISKAKKIKKTIRVLS